MEKEQKQELGWRVSVLPFHYTVYMQHNCMGRVQQACTSEINAWNVCICHQPTFSFVLIHSEIGELLSEVDGQVGHGLVQVVCAFRQFFTIMALRFSS